MTRKQRSIRRREAKTGNPPHWKPGWTQSMERPDADLPTPREDAQPARAHQGEGA